MKDLEEQITEQHKYIEKLESENERLQKWVHDLQTGTYMSCVYCGYQYSCIDEVPATMEEHIEQCSEHPMFIKSN